MTDANLRGAGEDDGTADREQPPRRRGRRGLVISTLVVLAILFGAMLVGSRLLAGPIFTELGTDRLSAELASAAGTEKAVHIGVLGVSLTADLQPRIHLRDVVVERPGIFSVSLDEIAVATDWWTLLGRSGRARELSVDHLVVGVTPQGRLPPGFPTILAEADRIVRTTGIQHVEIASLTVVRHRAGERLVIFEEAAVAADVTEPGKVRVSLAGRGRFGPWSVKADARTGDGSDDRTIKVRTRGVDMADVFRMISGEASPLRGPVAFAGEIGVTADKVVSGAGELSFDSLENTDPEGGAPVLSRGRLSVDYAADAGRIDIQPSPIVLAAGHALLSGRIQLPEQADGTWGFELGVDGHEAAAFGRPDLRGVVRGSYDPVEGFLSVDEFRAAGTESSLVAAMRLRSVEGTTIGVLSGVFPRLSVPTLKAFWPSSVVDDARRWIDGHVFSGTITDAEVGLSLAGTGLGHSDDGAASGFLDFRFEALRFRPFDDGPLVRDAIGRGRLEGGRLEILLESGIVDLEDGRTLTATSGSFVIPDITADPAHGEADIALDGDIEGAFGIWERLPLSEQVSLPLGADDVTGTASATIRVGLPLIDDVMADQVTYGGVIRFRDADIGVGIDGRTVSDADLDLVLGDGTARITGLARIDGVPADIDITRSLERGGPEGTTVRMVLDEAQRRKLGFDLGGAVVGPVAVSITDGAGADDGPRLLEVDFAKAEVTIGALGYTKAAGRPGRAVMRIDETGDEIRIDGIELELPDARASGSMVLGPGGSVKSASFPSVSLSGSERLSVTAARRGERMILMVRGRSLDARAIVKERLRQSADRSMPAAPMDLDLAVDNVTGFGGEVLRGVNVAARMEGGRLAAMTATAQTAGGGSASMTLTPIGSARRLELEVGEIGRLLRFADLYGRVFGGRATITGIIDAAGTLTAAVDGSRWRIVEEPALERLSTAAEEGPTAGISTVEISRLLFEMEFANGRLTIEDGIIRGKTAGLSIQGDVDFRADSLRLGGTYLPASAFDSLLGRIPLIGQIVSAGGRAGLLGVTFRITGPMDAPTLSVNPLSVIAPGIFRKLFEMQ